MAARDEEGSYEKRIFTHLHVRQGLSNDDAAVARGIVCQEIRPVAGFETGDFVKKKGWGIAVERPVYLLIGHGIDTPGCEV